MSWSDVKKEFHEHLQIPLKDIISATDDFSATNLIGEGRFGKTYKGQLSQGKLKTMVAVKRFDRARRDSEFWNEIMWLSHYKHENLVSLVGICDDEGENILVYEYLSNRSLDLHLSSTDLSWNQRLRICIGAARGINYLHSPPILSLSLLHSDIKSANILLDQNWNAKIADFGLRSFTSLVSDTAGTMGYVDPSYRKTGILTEESDVYSFGVVLFEVLCGRLSIQNTKDISRFLAELVQKRYEENKLDTLVKTSIKEQMSPNSFEIFSRIAYQCLRPEREDRPLMTEIVQELEIALQYQKMSLYDVNKEFEHLRIPLKDIISATDDFSATNFIGEGRLGKIYKGQLSLNSQGKLKTMVAVKRFHLGRRDSNESWYHIMRLSYYKHENLVSLVGICYGEGENILVYEYLSNKSLDLYLSSTDLSWNQRLRICIGAARGIDFLHNNHSIDDRMLIHCYIKSSNVLLDQNWNAKIADFGVSKFPTADKQHTFGVYNTGTMGYFDPSYIHTGILTKESDVYSFGVVLFEVLCGRLSFQNTEDSSRFLAVLVQKRYEENKLDTLVKTSIKEQISPNCFERFSRIAYQCLRPERQDRPLITEIVQELEIALQYQEAYEKDSDDEDDFWETRLPEDWKVMITKFNIPRAIYTTKRDLFSLLHKGILFDEGNKFLWINNDGTKCLLISAKRFVELNEGKDHRWVFQHGSSRHLLSRFPVVVEYLYGKWHEIRCQIKTSILSLGTMYAANLVFKCSKKPNKDLTHLRLMTLRWKVEESSVYSTHYAELTDDNWYKLRMWNFVNHGLNANFDIEIEELSYYDNPVESGLLIQGIEFQPIEMMQHKEIKRIKSLMIPDEEDIDDDLYWEKKLPKDYHQYIEISDKHLHYTSKKELYLLLCTGFLAYGGKLWLFLCKSTGGICSILPATHILCEDTSYESLETLPLPKSRFREVKELGTDDWYLFTCRLRPFMFSPNYIYACYLVFKFGDNHVLSNNALKARTKRSFFSTRRARIQSSRRRTWSREFFKVKCKLGDIIHGTVFAHMTSTPPINIPTIMPKNYRGSHDSSIVPSIEGYGMPKGHMDLQNSWRQERNDGWMEVRLSKSLHQLENHMSLEVKLCKPEGGSFSGIIVEGIEFRPMQDVSDF